MSPGERVTREAVLQFIEYLKASGNSEVTIHAQVRTLLTGMHMFAPEADWSWLRIVETNLRKTMKPSVDKRHQVRPVRELFACGLRLMDEAEKSNSSDRVKVAIQYRDGLLIAIFSSRAPRRGVVTLMEIGTHLIREGDLYWLVFDETEMKGGRFSDKYLPSVAHAVYDALSRLSPPIAIARSERDSPAYRDYGSVSMPGHLADPASTQPYARERRPSLA